MAEGAGWQPTIDDTIRLVDELFAGLTDKAGEPYREHCIRVMQRLPADASEDEKHAALLHDVFEDTHFCGSDLIDRGYSEDVAVMVYDVTRIEGETYLDFIRRAAGSPARRIKLADLQDNSDPERLAKLSPDTARRLRRKYQNALALFTPESP